MNLTGFRTQLSAKLSLNLSDSAELALIDGWVNEGVEYVVGETGSRTALATAALTASQGDYELDSNILRILWIQAASSSDHEITQVGPTEIRRRRLGGSPDNAQLYAVDGANMLMLWPIPSAADTLTVAYVPRPATLTIGTDIPTEIPAEFHRLVTLYALLQGGDYDDDQSSAQGSRYEDQLEKGLKKMRSRLNKKRGRQLARATVSRRNRRLHRNDIDES